MKRTAHISRRTAETDILVALTLEGEGKTEIQTDCGFMEHMLTLFSSHSLFDLKLNCKGDSYVDYHHSVEDMGICLGQAVNEALGEKRGITRYGHIILPMDEALILCAVDLGGRSALNFDVEIPTEKVGDFDTELVQEFFTAFVREARCNLHIKQLAGINSHHIIEGIFKAFARSMKMAVAYDTSLPVDKIPSTKEVL